MTAEKSMAADKAGRENSAAAWEAEYDQVRDLLSRKFMPLRFPPALEPHGAAQAARLPKEGPHPRSPRLEGRGAR